MWKRLSYANVMATLALFFALTGTAAAGVKYLTTTTPIPSSSDLTGTYGNPLIADGKITSGKITDGAVTNSKLGVTARMWAVIGGDGSVLHASSPGVTADHFESGGYYVDFGAGAPDLRSCAAVATTAFFGVVADAHAVSAQSELVGVTDPSSSNPVSPDFSIVVFC